MRKATSASQQSRRDFIAAHWRAMSDAEMSDALSVTRDNVAHIRRRLSLTREKGNIQALHAHGRNKDGWKRHTRDISY